MSSPSTEEIANWLGHFLSRHSSVLSIPATILPRIPVGHPHQPSWTLYNRRQYGDNNCADSSREKADDRVGVDIRVYESDGEAVRAAVDAWVARIRAGARVLGLATGATMIPFYREWVRRMAGDPVIKTLITFNLDEYYGIGQDHPGTFRRYMDRHCFGPLGLLPHQVHFLPADPLPDVDRICLAYEAAIRAAGGLDLCLLGIGPNGHLAFNEPGTAFDSRTHLAALTDETRRANQDGFPGETVPERALTMGIATIMGATDLVLLAFGPAQAPPHAQALAGPIDPHTPASVLQQHPRVTVHLDRTAAAWDAAPATSLHDDGRSESPGNRYRAARERGR
jgi:glucosamine-6-phosphate deaminase